MRMAYGDIARLAGVTGVGIGIMWALQALGFGPTWVICAAAGAGAIAGAVVIGASLNGDVARMGLQATDLPEIA